jgi:DNA-binding response OmpR family regulator
VNRGTPIVILEDDDAHRELIARLLEHVAPDSSVLPLGPEHTDSLADLAPFGALLLLDRRLGADDSLSLIRPLRAERPDLAVTVMSAFVTPEDRVMCHAAGARSTFQKPGDLNGWRSVLMSLFDDDGFVARAA